MKRFLYIMLCLLPLLACTREESPNSDVDDAPDGRVTVTFSVSMPAKEPSTKALSEQTELETMYLAVYGSTGGYKEYVKATPVKKDPDTGKYTPVSTPTPSEEIIGGKTVDVYSFSVSLQLSNTDRTIHFLGNGPDPSDFGTGKARTVLPDVLGGENETGFWQMISLDGIYARQDPDTREYLNEKGEPKGDDDPYVVSQKTLDAFGQIPLVRNWAKIVLEAEENSHFVPKSFAVINAPKRGTLVPYGGNLGFIEYYQNKSFKELVAMGYAGNLPDGVSLSGVDAASIPTHQNFLDGGNGAVLWTPEAAVYLYERPIPNDVLEPTYVLIYGTYTNTDDPALAGKEGEDCYYKIDLMDKGSYFPIYRNFRYKIRISNIASLGFDSPEKAAASAGSADVSADVNASHLSDISDGTRRMNVQPWMSKTFIEGVDFDPEKLTDNNPDNDPDPHLFVIFYDNINTDPVLPNTDYNPDVTVKWPVWLELIPENAKVILNPVLGAPLEDGFRPIYFGVAEPGNVAKSQTLRINCMSDPDSEETPLYRDIVITIRPRQEMKVSCRYPRVNRIIGQSQEIVITVPDGLSESMFPLEFLVEPQKMTLSPDNDLNNMPVEVSPSLVDDSKSSYHFIRTLSWDEYKALPIQTIYDDEIEDISRWRQFSCYFKTNCEYSGTTVYVYNKFFHGEKIENEDAGPDTPVEYREYAYSSFTDFRSFDNPHFTTSIPRLAGANVQVGVGAEKGKKMWMQIKNLTPAEAEYDSNKGMYWITPQEDELLLNFTTSTSDGDVSITFIADDDSYESFTLKPWLFSNVGFVNGHALISSSGAMSNVAFGYVNDASNKSNNVVFAYCVDTDAPFDSKNKKTGPKVTFKNIRGFSKVGGTTCYVNGVYSDVQNEPGPFINGYSGRSDYHEILFNTLHDNKEAREHNASVTLSSVGFVEEDVEAGRFHGDIRTANFAKADLKKTTNLVKNTDRGCYFHVDFSGGKADATNGGITLPAGSTYTMTVTLTGKNSNPNIDGELFYVQVIYDYNYGSPKLPLFADVEPEESTYVPYMGNSNEYIWSFPRETKQGTLSLTAASGTGNDIVITGLVVKCLQPVQDYSGPMLYWNPYPTN